MRRGFRINIRSPRLFHAAGSGSDTESHHGNRLAENAGWDRELLGLELRYLSELDIDLDVTITGFDPPQIDVLIGELSLDGDVNDPADAVPEPAAGPAVTRPRDIWRIGPHRLIGGDAMRTETNAALVGSEKSAMIFTDPPYNVQATIAHLTRSSLSTPGPTARSNA